MLSARFAHTKECEGKSSMNASNSADSTTSRSSSVYQDRKSMCVVWCPSQARLSQTRLHTTCELLRHSLFVHGKKPRAYENDALKQSKKGTLSTPPRCWPVASYSSLHREKVNTTNHHHFTVSKEFVDLLEGSMASTAVDAQTIQ